MVVASLSVWIHREPPSPLIRLAAKRQLKPPKFIRTVFLLWMFTPTLALGLPQGEDQGPSRAAWLEGQGQTAVETVVPQVSWPAHSALPRGDEISRFVANLMQVWNGFHFATGDFPAGAGFGYGVGYTYSSVSSSSALEYVPDRLDVDVVAAYSTRRYALIGFDLRVRNFRGTPLHLALHGKASEFPEEEFFGFGRASREEDRTNYLQRSLDGGVDLWVEPLKRLRVGGGVSYLSPSIGSGRDDRFVSTEDFFNQATLPGYQNQPDFWRFDGFLDFDYRDQPWNPHAGGYFGGRLSSFRDRHLDTFHFRRFEGDLQHYFPFSRSDRVLALRANLVMTDFSVGDAVPFYYQPTLGGGEKLRGFRESRFRDLNSLLFTAEYRWRAWWALDTALFLDAGKVTFDHADIHLKNLEASYGFGLRFHSSDALVLRIDLAFSSEGFIPLFRFRHVF